jgi:hypothetical protein
LYIYEFGRAKKMKALAHFNCFKAHSGHYNVPFNSTSQNFAFCPSSVFVFRMVHTINLTSQPLIPQTGLNSSNLQRRCDVLLWGTN